MLEVLGSIWWLIVALGLLVTFHEFGHYWVARRCGVKVLKFSVGFGQSLWSRQGADGTVWTVAAVPLGGFVKMLDEREGEVSEDQLDESFNRKPVLQRIAIVAAGPIFNLVFAVFAFWVMFMVGVPETRPVIGEPSGIAASAGMLPEDEIITVDGDRTATWSHALLALITHALDRDQITLELEQPDGERRTVTMDLADLGADFNEERTLEAIGLAPWRAQIPPVIGEVIEGSPAEEANLRPGDVVTAINGEATPGWGWVTGLIGKYGSEGQPMTFSVERNGMPFEQQIAAREVSTGFMSKKFQLGIVNQLPDEALTAKFDRAYMELQYGPIEGFQAALAETARLTGATLGILGRMLTGSASVKNISGPIGIAQFANDSANAGLTSFLFFLGLISLSLGILNLLPIPVLDGGHLLYYLIELVKGSPVSDQVQVTGQYVGLVALFGLIGLGVINDILRLVG